MRSSIPDSPAPEPFTEQPPSLNSGLSFSLAASPAQFRPVRCVVFAVRLLTALAVWNCLPARAAIQTLPNAITPFLARLAPVGRLDASRHLRLAISLPLRNSQRLAALLAQIEDPASPNYRHYLTPAQFAAQFGPAQKDYDAVAAFAAAHGLTVTARHPNRLVLDVDGPVTAIERTFHVTMRTYRHPTEHRNFFAADRQPSVDSPIPLLHVSGLDDYSLPHPNLHPRPALLHPGATPSTGAGPSGSYAGGDFRAAYVPHTALTGSGQSVALLQFDGFYSADITAYNAQFGLPKIPLVVVPIDGGVPAPGSGVSEVSLDIEMASSMAPGLSAIYVYEAPNPSPWIDLLSRMADDDLASQMSCSWSGGDSGDPGAEQIFTQMAMQGQSFYVASGDSDADTGAISFPIDSPNVTAVGATTLTTSGSGGSYVSETVWNWGNGQGSSGGVSTTYAIPSWQKPVSMTASQGSTTMRNVPDVAMVGDNVYVIYDNGQAGIFGGTSCAAPLWAGFTALANQQALANGKAPAGFLNPALYTIGLGSSYAAAFHDTTTGNNFSSSSPSLYSAVTGYDLCTGWGAPAGAALINSLAGPPTPIVSTLSPLPGGLAGIPYSVPLTASGGAAPYGWSISAGSLPSGLALGATTGLISGTPQASGSFAFTVQVTDTNGVESQTPFTLAIYPSGTPLIVTASPLATGTLGVPYNQSFAASGGAAPYAWSIVSGSAPAGLTLGATGILAGTPAATGTFAFGVQVTGSDGLASVSAFRLTIPPLSVITSPASATGTNGAPFYYQISATNGPTGFGATGLPAGVALNPSTGLISGTPTAPGTFNATISAINIGGTASLALAITIAQMPAPVIICPYATVHSFDNADGANPIAGLTQAIDGNLYGATNSGGNTGDGTVYRMTPGGALTTLYSFTGPDGDGPEGNLIQASNGILYGTTVVGGALGYGNIFQMTMSGSFTSLASFNSSGGSYPFAPLVQGTDGDIYGTTIYGGLNGDGAVFQMTPAGTLNTLVSFNGSNGLWPEAALVQGTNGAFYGSTQNGGSSFNGNVFTVSASGSLNSLVSFSGEPGGDEPYGALVQGSDGNFYGTTLYGGASGDGNVFKLTPRGRLTNLYSFSGADGSLPVGGLVQGSDGNFYGATNEGGTANEGTIFMMTSSGSLTTLYSFGASGSLDGVYPQMGLLLANNGLLYGTAYNGGSAGLGTIYSLTPFNIIATVGVPFTYAIRTISNTPPSQYSSSTLPAGLTLNQSTGLISGTPTATGSNSVTITATNPGGSGSATLAISVVTPAPAITSPLTATGTTGVPFSYRITATNAPSRYGASALPAGLTFDPVTGLISGSPTVAATSSVTISAINVSGTRGATLTLTFLSPYAAWQHTWFSSAQLINPGISGDTASPAHDGIPNLLKYALNLNPTINDQAALPSVSLTTAGGVNYLTLKYTQVLNATDITYTPQVSSNMQTWNSGPAFLSPVSIQPNGDGVTETVVVQDRIPASSGPRFIRLQVTGP